MLYKYTKAVHLAAILAEEYLWFSHIDALNDPFECHLSQFRYGYGDYKKEQMGYFKTMHRTQIRPSRPARNHFFDYPMEDQQTERQINDFISEYMETFRQYTARRAGLFILSLSKTKESPVLWGNYADNFKGVCLCVDEAQIEHALTLGGYDWKKAEVVYTTGKSDPHATIPATVDAFVKMKHSDWSYEQEVRYIIYAPNQKVKGFKVPVEGALAGVCIFEKDGAHVSDFRREFGSKTKIDVLRMGRWGWFETGAA